MSAAVPPGRAAARVGLAGLAAGTLALALGIAPAAGQEGSPDGAPGLGTLRAGTDLDLAAARRATAPQPVASPFSATRDQTPSEPSARPSPGAAGDAETDEPDEDEPPPLARPRIDLFAPSPGTERAGRAASENVAARGAEPAPAFQDPFAPTIAPSAGERRQGRVRAGLDERSPIGEPAPSDAPRVDDPAALDRSGLSLASEPLRSSRTQALDGRLALRATPLRGTRPAAVDDPFAPIGLRLGSFLLYAALDQSAGYSTNLDRTANGRDGAFSDTTLTTRFLSDWSRHQAEVNVLANYRRNFGGELRSDPDVTVDGRLRLDVDRLTTANLRGGLVYRKEDDTDLDATPEIDGQDKKPDILNYSLGADLERQFGDAFARGTVSAIRETRSGGDLPSALDENFNTYTAALRAGYAISPAFAPFVEGSVGRRIFDEDGALPNSERDSVIPALRGGVTFDFGEKLSGEIAAGYAWNEPDAGAVATSASPTVDAKLNWSPRRGTDLALTATTTFDPDTTGLTTSTLYQLGLAARHRATAQLDLDASLLAGYRDSDLAAETQRTWGASVGFTYWINRSLAFIGLATHDDVDRLHSPGDYTVDTVKLGIRLQN